MKIYKNLYWSIISPASLFHAWDIFKNDKRNRLDVANFEFNLEDNIFKLYNDYNNFGFCVLSNEPFFILPCLPTCSIKTQINNIDDIYEKNKNSESLGVFIVWIRCLLGMLFYRVRNRNVRRNISLSCRKRRRRSTRAGRISLHAVGHRCDRSPV